MPGDELRPTAPDASRNVIAITLQFRVIKRSGSGREASQIEKLSLQDFTPKSDQLFPIGALPEQGKEHRQRINQFPLRRGECLGNFCDTERACLLGAKGRVHSFKRCDPFFPWHRSRIGDRVRGPRQQIGEPKRFSKGTWQKPERKVHGPGMGTEQEGDFLLGPHNAGPARLHKRDEGTGCGVAVWLGRGSDPDSLPFPIRRSLIIFSSAFPTPRDSASAT